MKKLFFSVFAIISFSSVNAQTDSLQQYVGQYVFPDGSVVPSVEVTVADGALSMSSAAGTSPLTQLGIDSFQLVQFNGTAVFKRGDDKNVNAVHIDAMGYIMDGHKQANGIWIFQQYYLPAGKGFLTGKK